MFIPKLVPPSMIALAITAAFSHTASAEPVRLDTPVQPAQTYFPKPGAVDIERSNTLVVIRQIKADYAYARNITGKGVIIGVLDTGITASHREFSEAGKLMSGFNAITGTSNVVDKAGHGTHVAGTIGAGRNGSGVFGVAYDARLLPIKVLNDNGSGSTSYLDKGLRYAIGKASIVNMSLGATTAYDPRAMQEAVRGGLLIVAAAGNDTGANPNWPARFAKESWANNQIIAVGAVDANNRISSFSNRAGDTAAWYIVAPGVQILSTYMNGQYATMSGTSMATPAVSGAAALVKQLWPSLRADQIANILFLTATDLGVPGIDAVYGRGLLNIEKALQPIGTVTTTTFNGRTISVVGSTVRPSAATSRLWTLAASGNLRILGLDDYKRDFNIDLGGTVAKPASLSIEQIFNTDSRMEVAERVLADGSTLSVAYDRKLPVVGKERVNSMRLAGFSLVSKSLSGRETALGTGGLASNYFGLGGLDVGHGMSFGTVSALSNPYFTLVPVASHAAVAQEIGGVKVKFGVMTSGLNQMFASQEESYVPDSWTTAQRANSALVEVSKSFGAAAMSVSFSQINESNAYLGSQSRGALLIAPHAATSSIQLAGAFMLAPKLALAGQVSYGFTPGMRGDESLITEVTTAKTNAFSLALVASDRIRTGDRFSVAVSQPMRTYSGQIAIDVLTGLSSDDVQTRERLHFSMEPAGRELTTELNYHSTIGKDASAGVTFMLRRDPNNLSNVPMEKLLAMRYMKQF